MLRSAFGRGRDAVVVCGMAGLLALGFTSALSGPRGPDYSMQPYREQPAEVTPGVDCELLDLTQVVLGEPTGTSEDRRFRRDLWRARRILGCDG